MTRKFRKPRRLTRSHSKVAPQPVLLVVCEGQTEARLLCQLRGHLRIPQLKVDVVGGAGVPKSVVERAVKRRNELGKSTVDAWVVFDRDEHPWWTQAIDRALAQKVRLAISNPCFELWALLLHQDQFAHIERHAVQRALATLHPSYHHDRHPYLDCATVLDHSEAAASRSQSLLIRAQDRNDPNGNPTTRFHELIERLFEVARELAFCE